MQNLPVAEVYEKEFSYMPWGILMQRIEDIVTAETPVGGKVLDLLCGPGYLLGKLQQRRPDLHYVGVDLEPEFILYAKKQYSNIDFIVGDATNWETNEQFDVALCTAGLHHLPYEKQESFLQRLKGFVKSGGKIIVADPCADDFENEDERKRASAKLGYEYLVAVLEKNAPPDVIASTVDILKNDVLLVEFKSSIRKLLPIFTRTFGAVDVEKTWPKAETGYGDYIFISTIEGKA